LSEDESEPNFLASSTVYGTFFPGLEISPEAILYISIFGRDFTSSDSDHRFLE